MGRRARRRPGAFPGGGMSRAATSGPDRWLFTTELGLQVPSLPEKRPLRSRLGRRRLFFI